jgi:U4/U6 small nuclear ribonucleoprotein PRP31
MATLADSFLADLDELEEDGGYEGGDAGRMELDAGGAVGGAGAELAEALKFDDLDTVAPLVHTERYQSTVQARRGGAGMARA